MNNKRKTFNSNNNQLVKFTANYNSSAVRFPQAISLDFNAIRSCFGTDSTIITDLIVYISKNTKIDLFNNIKFTLSDFAKVMNYNPSNLRRVEKEFDNRNKPILQGHTFDGVLEFALYRMLKENVIFEGNYEGKYRAKSFQLIQELNIYNNNKINTKRIYEIKPSSFLIETLFREFYTLNIEDYVLAGSLNSRDRKTIGASRSLYMELVRELHIARFQYKQGLPPSFETTIDYLSGVCYFDLTRPPAQRKRDIIKLLDKLKNLIHLKFDYEFYSPKGKNFSYHIKITYSNECLKDYETELETKFHNYLYAVLKQRYDMKYSGYSNSESSFSLWLSKDVDMDLKIGAVQTAYRSIFNESLDIMHAQNYINTGICIEKWKL